MSLRDLAPVAMAALGLLMLVMGLSTLGRVFEGSWKDRLKWLFIFVSFLFAGAFLVYLFFFKAIGVW
jgi:hypothetical protein